ncbi:hypothetical protein GCM10011588_33880 [Nocardia jinanensis]|uniref:HTH-type transcriptional regulator MT1864/Rv1816-like C-terminal domain-containing protein n=2 Tax=Nocardia jinanensis TaxID=382504 RepID=A0A917RP51_9NOCA|nr:hypothetical protein GCM10011588_33880 [Nocardia jinanensis]
MLAAREAVTIRSLVSGTSVSTMALYTYFGGLPGLWSAVRQEGFTRLAARIEEVHATEDPVHDLAALGAVYMNNALADPHLYRVMFDADFELADPAAADATLHHLVVAVERARDTGRFRSDIDPLTLATQTWLIGHGAASLVTHGPLPAETIELTLPVLVALFAAAGDDTARCRRSVETGWRAQFPADAGSIEPRP